MVIPYIDYLIEHTVDNTTIPNEVVALLLNKTLHPLKLGGNIFTYQ
jgi:hypothetical protein